MSTARTCRTLPFTPGNSLFPAIVLTVALCSTAALCSSTPLQAQASAPQAITLPPPPDSLGVNTFGFYAGETKQQIIAAIGQAALLKTDGDILEVNAAPKPDPNFDTFLLVVAPKQGLVKLIATGKDIEDDPSGKLMRAQFTALKADLTKLYGEPGDVFDFINSKSTLKAPNQFMIALTKTERSLSAYWTKKDFGNQITSISLEGNGLGDDKGYLSLEFEFAGIHDYLVSTKKK